VGARDAQHQPAREGGGVELLAIGREPCASHVPATRERSALNLEGDEARGPREVEAPAPHRVEAVLALGLGHACRAQLPGERLLTL
jgi:hypothetical protein